MTIRMENFIIKEEKMKYVLFLIMMLFSSQAVALNCEKQPTCAELGYSTQDNPNCLDDGYLICPFDSNYKKCVNFNCESLGFTQSDKSAWCKNIAACPNNKNYTACIKATCEIGDVYYSDGSCGLVEDYNGSKTPVGVVYYVSDGGYHGKVINLKDLGKEAKNKPFDPANPYNTSYQYWGYYNYNIPELTNYNSNDNMLTQLQNRDQGLYDGKSNTVKILSASGLTNCNYDKSTEGYYQHCIAEAAQAARDFYPLEGLKEDSKVGQGKWYLPALGELMDLYGYNNSDIMSFAGKSGANGNTKNTVNTTLTALKNKGVTAAVLSSYYYWSSSENNSLSSWNFGMGDGNRANLVKNEARLIRASLEF